MSEKRRDRKNRILKNGETQRPDGRYRFTYTDVNGSTKDVYSWRLDKNDPLPKGKRKDLSLREKEKQIEQDMFNQIVSNGGNYTVLSLVEKYVALKTGVRHSTEAGYKTVINLLKKDSFGQKRIDKVKLSDAKAWLIKLQQTDGKGYSSIHSIRGVLRPAFQMAENDDLIRKNPFQFELATVVVNDSVTREAITRKQQRDYMKFIKEDKHFCKYYEGIFILFNTGLRISEFCGLTVSDIDFKKKRINVERQLIRTRQMEYIIEAPKTESGVRYVPMTDEVSKCFQSIIEKRIIPTKEPNVEGHTGFLFLDKNDMPMVSLHWEKYMQHIREKYNSIYRVPMPKITPHVCRHTFCSNMAKSGMNPKTLQYIMGHSDISVTLNTYTHVKIEDAENELSRLTKTENGKTE
ncbi:site-specific integrase [Ruminococcus albus]|uniref:Site-specific recombinase XerD n=1 Tax=Ruminococcus albus TaxID=1264 RepID=A0A1I1RAG9_RUMAL|nr:site-specific integrase [Ruminococcus albus]SFD31117.1 Site-specific recombinase XerD [Ruminococcus albus]